MLTQNQKPKPTEIWIESSLKPILRTPSVTPYSRHTLPIVRGNRKYPIIHAQKKERKLKPKTKTQNDDTRQRTVSPTAPDPSVKSQIWSDREECESEYDFWRITYRTPYYSLLLLLLFSICVRRYYTHTRRTMDIPLRRDRFTWDTCLPG